MKNSLKMLKLLKFLLIITALHSTWANTETVPRTCEPIRIELCRGIGYNETSMPNLVWHELQSDAEFTLQTFSPLIQYGCSAQLHFFLCAVYVPMCTSKVQNPIGPCRGLCETVRARCHPILQGFGFPWPTALDCDKFPEENNHLEMCMEGPGEPDGGGASGPPIPSNKITSYTSTCQSLQKSHLYVRLNKSSRCTPLCEGDIMFEISEKHLAEIWILTWSVAASCTAIIAILCLILSKTRWDKVLLPLVICHCLVTVGWAIRWLAGRNATACGYDSQYPGVSLLLNDGLSTSPCAATFLLRYYFGMAAAVWVAILCYQWNTQLRRHLMETIGEPLPAKKENGHRKLLLVVAWGLPAIQTIIALAARLVDADELLGSCFIGNQSDKTLLSLVAIPLLTYWMISSGYLLTGYLRKKSMEKHVSSLPAHINAMGTFLFIYCIPSGLLLATMFYQFGSRESWLNIPDPSPEPVSASKAPVWLFITQAFLELLVGVLASAWAIGPRIAGLCKTNQKPVVVYKQPPATKFHQSPYHAASYQTICPPNSMVSSNNNFSIGTMGTIGRMQRQHIRSKYPPSHTHSHSQYSRKPRAYRTASHATMSLNNGHETVF